MKTLKLTFIFSLFLMLCGSINACNKSEPLQKSTTKITVGDTIPKFNVVLTNGKSVTTDMLKGKISVIMLFRTTCSDSRDELPIMQKVYDKYKDNQNINFVLISQAQNETIINPYWQEHNLTLPVSAQTDDKVYKQFATSVVPIVLISNKDNIVKFIRTDNPIAKEKEMLKEIETLLQ